MLAWSMKDWVFYVRSRPFFVLISLFALVTAATYYDVVAPADIAVLDMVHTLGGKNHTVDMIMGALTETSDVYYMLGFGVLLLIIRRTRRIGLSIMISLVIVTIITGYAKCGIDRERPELEYLGHEFPIEASPDTFSLFCDNGFDASYPSGHASRAAVFGIVLGAALYSRMGSLSYLLLLYPALVSISRVYILEHYPSDVIGGVILGFLIAGIISKRAGLQDAQPGSETQRLK